MALIEGKGFRTREQAVDFLLWDLHLLLNPEVVEWFSYARNHFPQSELDEKGDALVSKQVRKSFTRNTRWHGEIGYIAVPYYSFNTSYLDFTIDLHLVASIKVELPHYKDCIVRELIKGRIEKFRLPLAFIDGISKGDLSQFERRGDDSRGYFTWYVPSLNQEIRLHASFLKCLKEAFLGKPLGPSLVFYGLTGLWGGVLIEQRLLSSASSPVPVLKPSWSEEDVRSALERLGATKEQRNKAISYLKEISPQPSSLEEAISAAVEFIGGQKPP